MACWHALGFDDSRHLAIQVGQGLTDLLCFQLKPSRWESRAWSRGVILL